MSDSSDRMVKFVITRFDPDKDEVPKTQEYEIECESHWKVLDAINFIKDHCGRRRNTNKPSNATLPATSARSGINDMGADPVNVAIPKNRIL